MRDDYRDVEGDRFKGLILVVASLWPLFLLYAVLFFAPGDEYPKGMPKGPWMSIGLSVSALLLIAASRSTINSVKKNQSHEFVLQNWIPKDEQVAGFLLSYVFPFLVPIEDLMSTKGVAYALFLLGFLCTLWHCNLYHINPAILVNGYRLFEVEEKNEDGDLKIWLLAKGPRPNKHPCHCVKITPVLWIEVEKSRD